MAWGVEEGAYGMTRCDRRKVAEFGRGRGEPSQSDQA